MVSPLSVMIDMARAQFAPDHQPQILQKLQGAVNSGPVNAGDAFFYLQINIIGGKVGIRVVEYIQYHLPLINRKVHFFQEGNISGIILHFIVSGF